MEWQNPGAQPEGCPSHLQDPGTAAGEEPSVMHPHSHPLLSQQPPSHVSCMAHGKSEGSGCRHWAIPGHFFIMDQRRVT